MFKVTLTTQGGETFTYPQVEILDSYDQTVYLYESGSNNPHFFKWGSNTDNLRSLRQEKIYAN